MNETLLEVSYLGQINQSLDKFIKSDIPDILYELKIECEWEYQECTIKDPMFRNIGFSLDRELTDFERIEFNCAIRMLDERIFITRL